MLVGLAPAALACDAEILVSLYTAGDVARVDACDGSVRGFLDDRDLLAGAQALRMGPDGLLYVVSEENDRILRFDGDTLAFVDVWLEDARLAKPTAIDFGPDGAAYIGSYGGDRVLRYLDGVLTTFLEDPALDGIDAGMSFGPDGQLWIPAFDGHAVLVVDPATAEVRRRITTLESPRMLLWTPARDAVLIGAWAGDAVHRLERRPGAQPELLFARARPSGLAWLPDGRLLSISDTGGPIHAVDLSGPAPTAVRLAEDPRLEAMTFLLVRPARAAD